MSRELRLVSVSLAMMILMLLAAACGSDGTLGGGPELDGSIAEATTDAGAGGDATSGGDAVADAAAGARDAVPGADGAGTAGGATYHVAPDGDDTNAGTLAEPLGTIAHALGLAVAGDTIVLGGGTYALDRGLALANNGAEGSPIRLVARAGETPVLDFSSNPRHANPPEPREDDSIAATGDAVGLLVSGDHWHVAGLTVRNAAYYGVRVYGSHNVIERLVLHDNKASGLEITGKEGHKPSHNLVRDCDSFHNFDSQGNGEDADGFAAKFDGLGPGNVFSRLRAWSNADDGYDFWHAVHPVQIEECWAFDNGFNRAEWASQLRGGWQGDGMGFKLGQQASELVLTRVVAFGNKGFGIDANGNSSAGGVTINHATLVNNAKNGNPVQLHLVDDSPHTVRNTVAFDVDGGDVVEICAAVDHQSNSWNGAGAKAADFVNLDMDALLAAAKGPRASDGSLPAIGLRPSASSGLIDAGSDLGLPFEGKAPDLGAFEHAAP